MFSLDKKQYEFYEKYYQGFVSNQGIPDLKITNHKEVYGKKILVAGVGMGRDVSYLIKDNDVYGIDISLSGLEIAKKKGIKVKIADVDRDRIPYGNSQFDIVVCKDLLEHLINPLFLLKEIYRVLKKSGYLVVNVPNHFHWWLRLRILFGKSLIWKVIGQDQSKIFNEWDYMHIRYFTWKGFQAYLKKGDFKIVKRFWDFGTLAHYNNPEFVLPYLLQSNMKKGLLQKLLIKYGNTFWKMFNIVFPKSLRYKIVNISPGLLCASFYLWCRPKNK